MARSYLGPVNVIDANEAEIFLLLVGCKKLKALIGAKAIIEGDSCFGYPMGLDFLFLPLAYA